MNAIDTVADLVHSRGAPRAECLAIAYYIADRSAGLSLATVHSSSRSALRADAFLTHEMRLTPRQVRAWLALIRGTGCVQRRGRTHGGRPGMVQALATGRVSEREQMRFDRLAHIAATNGLPRQARREPERIEQ